jgi:serpin B
MAQALHFGLPPAQLHPAFNALDQALASRGEGKLGADGGPMRLHIVNAVWAERSYLFLSDFLATLAGNYGAGINLLNFAGAPEPSRLTINAWVASQTEDRILNLLPEGIIDSTVKLVLTNAVYFNAQWATPFDPDQGYTGPFVRLDGSSVSTKFMAADLSALPVLQGPNFKAVSLPYADRRLSMLVVVPDAGQFAQVEAGLDGAALKAIVAGLTPKTVALCLPSFRTETEASLEKVLQALGMASAFAPGLADFSGMDGSRNLFVAAVRHKAFIDVAEKGTEAAAATAVVMRDGSIMMVDLSVWADHPFFYVVRDEPTGAILFMGRVLDPSMN